jgi:hypothetical protein
MLLGHNWVRNGSCLSNIYKDGINHCIKQQIGSKMGLNWVTNKKYASHNVRLTSVNFGQHRGVNKMKTKRYIILWK